MKKELAALLLLAVIVCVSLWNVRHLNRLLNVLQAKTTDTMLAAGSDRWEDAAQSFDALEDCWKAAKTYSQVFLRHPDIEAVTDALCVLRGAVLLEDAPACRTAALDLLTRLNSIRETETLTLGSIF